MKSIMQEFTDIVEGLQAAPRLLFLSDFDGTLTPIVERPELASIPEDVRILLRKLANCPRVIVGIVSGRALNDLKEKVKVEGLVYAGNHGFEIEGPGLKFVNPIAGQIRPAIRVVARILTLALGSLKGVFVEDKGITLSVHYRLAEENAAWEVRKIVERAVNLSHFRGLFRITAGKKVLELRPALAWDKGKAVRLLMKRYGSGGRRSGLVPIYLGDDLTDEDAFKIIAKYGRGLSVHVGEPQIRSAADYYLESTYEVTDLLKRLLDGRSGITASFVSEGRYPVYTPAASN